MWQEKTVSFGNKPAAGATIVAMWSQSGIRWAHAALLFGVCGAASSQLVHFDWGTWVLPIPFGVLAAWLFAEGALPRVLLVALTWAVWLGAYRTGLVMGSEGGSLRKLLAMCLAGLIGGFGVTVATAIARRTTPSPGGLVAVAAAGTICGLPFAAWLIAGNESRIPDWAQMLVSFTVWQGAVGFGLWRSFGTAASETA